MGKLTDEAKCQETSGRGNSLQEMCGRRQTSRGCQKSMTKAVISAALKEREVRGIVAHDVDGVGIGLCRELCVVFQGSQGGVSIWGRRSVWMAQNLLLLTRCVSLEMGRSVPWHASSSELSKGLAEGRCLGIRRFHCFLPRVSAIPLSEAS